MFEEVSLEANPALCTIMFKACASKRDERAARLGKKLLEQMPARMFSDTILINSAIHMLMNVRDVPYAERLFRQSEKNIATYGAMMKGERD